MHVDEEEFTVQRAFALHQMRKGVDALAVLEAAPEWLRRTGILHYNLGVLRGPPGGHQDCPPMHECGNPDELRDGKKGADRP
jgi:hypothetical protein